MDTSQNTSLQVVPIQATSLQERLVVGLTYSLLSAALFTIYTIFNIVLSKDREFRNVQAFRLMVFVGVLDCLQLLCHFVSGFLTVFTDINYDYPYLCKVFGGTLNSAWVGLFPLSLLVAVNRLLIFRKSISGEGKLSISMKIAVFLSFTYCFLFWICLLTFAEVTYDPKSFAWSYSTSAASKIMSEIEYIFSIICIVTTFTVYILISLSIYKLTRGAFVARRKEIHLVLHAAILFVILTSLITCWHYYNLFLPDTVWTLFSINVYWILYCGLNPLMYIVSSRKIRASCVRFIRPPVLKKSGNTVSIIVFPSSVH